MLNKMFKEPVLLDKNLHKDMSVAPLKNFNFAKSVLSVPVGVAEFVGLCKTYPILFIKDSAKNEFFPIALLGAKENENLFINDKGEWQKNSYIPALIRAYPFGVSQQQENNFVVVFDKKYSGINGKDGQKMFNDDGTNSEFCDNVIKFVSDVYMNLVQSRAVFRDYSDMFKQATMTITKGKDKFNITDVYIVDEEKLNSLSDEKFLELRKRGILPLFYAHLISLSNQMPL